jgi:homoserine dehydrogenase
MQQQHNITTLAYIYGVLDGSVNYVVQRFAELDLNLLNYEHAKMSLA